VSEPAQGRILHEAEIRVIKQCAEAPRHRLEFRGLDRMVAQLLHTRGWLERVEGEDGVSYRAAPPGLVALSVSQLTAAE
jgi:hypothetical protein